MKSVRFFFGVLVFLAALLLRVDRASSYEVVEVLDGGTIRGSVTFVGPRPEVEPLVVNKNQDCCGLSKRNETLLIDANGGVRNAVVTIEGIEKGKPFVLEDHELDNRDCAFVPHVQVVPLGQSLEIVNSDPILHNTHAYLGSRTVFNLALPIQGQRVARRMKQPGIVSVKCDAGHTWMSAYVLVVNNPYCAVTDSTGFFQITDIPPGSYEVKVWHEALGTETKTVEVKGGETMKVSFEGLKK
jgi:hypothetical protein